MSTQAEKFLVGIRDAMHADYLLVTVAYFAAKGLAGPDGGDVGLQGLITLLNELTDRLDGLRKDADELARLLRTAAPEVTAS